MNRVEGLALGAGASVRAGAGIVTSLRGRYGFSDHELKGRLGVALRRGDGTGVELFGARDYRDVGDVAERSTAVNSFAAQEFGSDATDPYDVRGARHRRGARRARRAAMARGGHRGSDRTRCASTRAPAWGSYERTIPAEPNCTKSA